MNDTPWLERPIPENTEPKIISVIEQSQLLIDRFGDWPSFHDAEVMKLTFESGNFLRITETNAWYEFIRESLTAQFYVFDWRYGTEYPPYRETLVTLRFAGFERFGLDRFSYQNPIIRLGITYEYSENLKKSCLPSIGGDVGYVKYRLLVKVLLF
jgi:hypothetical protein